MELGGGDGGPLAAEGLPPGGEKPEEREEKGSQAAPSLRASTVGARAAPSPGRVSAGAASAATSRGSPLGTVLRAPLDPQVHADPRSSAQQTAQGRGSGCRASDARGRAFSALYASSAVPPERSKTRSRQTSMSGSSPWTALPPGGWQGPSRVRSCWPQKGGSEVGSVSSSRPARYSQAAWVASSQAHLARPVITRRALPQASGAARGRRQASTRAAEQSTRATSRSSARDPASTRKLLPSLRRTAMADGRRWIPSHMLAWLAPAPRRRLSSTETPGAEVPPEDPLPAFARAASARARASTRFLLARRLASASRRCGAARASQVLSSEAGHLYWTLPAHSP